MPYRKTVIWRLLAFANNRLFVFAKCRRWKNDEGRDTIERETETETDIADESGSGTENEKEETAETTENIHIDDDKVRETVTHLHLATE